MGRRILILAAFLVTTTLQLTAQSGSSAFEFVENKGQWDSRVLFRGEIPAGEFYLHKNGFTVAQHNTNDLMRFYERAHGHTDVPEHPTKTGNIDPKPGGQNTQGANAVMIHSHAYRVQFAGGNENAQVVPEKVLPSYNNYIIGDDPSKWASNVRIYQAITYKNIYPNVDVRYYSEGGRMKYDLIVNPGGDVNDIVMKYEGADRLSIKNNELIIKTSVGDVKELYPYAYQFDKASGKKEVACNFQLVDKDKVRFSVKNYSKTSTLVIDPVLIFCSFTGSTASQWGFTATYGPDGSLYSGGIVFGSGFPTSPGAYMFNFQGGSNYAGEPGGIDMGIFKFNPTGTQRSYATYLGGKNGNDYPQSLICDGQGNLVVLGRSNADDYPGNKTNAGSREDIVITKLNATGTAPVGSIKIGGSGMDGVNIRDQYAGNTSPAPVSTVRFYGDDSRSEVVLDNAGNIYVAAQTQSDNFPTTAGVFQRNNGAASGSATPQDGCVLKVDATCNNLIWSSYLGGSENDAAFVLALNPANNDIYVAGTTSSTNFPGMVAGVYQPTYRGGLTDGFVSQISNDGTTLIRSSYFGTGSFDAIYGIQFDRNNIPYIMGTSEGSWPVQNVRYSNPNSKQFISKLRVDLSGMQYSTVFGSGSTLPNISPVAFLVDRCENVYVSGWGGATTPGNDLFNMAGVVNMPITSDAYKPQTDNRDFYFIVLKKDCDTLLYGTYFGQDGGFGEHVDGGTSRFDARGTIYMAICANCYNNAPGTPVTTKPFPTTPGVWGPVNGTGSGGCNLAAVKMAFNFVGVAEIPKAFIQGVYDTSGCVPLHVVFRDTIRVAKSYIWNFGDGTPDTTTLGFEVSHTYFAIGNYRVRLIGIDSSTCNIRDTAYTTIQVRDDRAILAMDIEKQQPCQALNYKFTNISTPPAGKPFKANSFIWDFGDGSQQVPAVSPTFHAYAGAGTYIVRLLLVDTNYCNAPDQIVDTLRVAENVVARFETPPDGCIPYTAIFNNTTLAGKTFFWDFGDGTTSNAMNPSHDYPNVGTYTVKLVAQDPNTCNKIDSVTHTISVHPIPTAEFNTQPIPALENTPTTFFNLSIGGVRYQWDFGDGESTVKTTMDTVMHQYNATGSYNACLTTFNEFDCPDTTCHQVNAIVVPLLDVPNAFTPGRFGQNGVIAVRGFGIGKMMWRIYNRWGQVIFQATDRKMAWDGTYKGQPQPMDVYAYTLDVEFTDGTKARKSGDITLIR